MGNKRYIRHFLQLTLLVIVGVFCFAIQHVAAQYNSTSYTVDEVYFGSGGANDLNSTNYQSRASLGDTGVGNVAGTAYQAYGGFTTASLPVLEVSVSSVNLDLGSMTTSATSSFTATFTVRAYLASGYSVYAIGAPPTNEGGAQIAPLTTGGTSTPGASQFGMNLVANTTPAIGAAPAQLPGTTFSFGQVMANYGIANTFRYNNGDKIAYSNSSSGSTQYTASYIINVSPIDKAGVYKFNQSIVVVATY